LLMFFPPFNWLQVNAEETIIENGSYQVELSFSSIEELGETIFSEVATLAVKNGQYKLELTLEKPWIVTDIQMKQLDNEITSTVVRENLVQFDVKDIHGPIRVNGVVHTTTEESLPFSQELHINAQTLIQLNKETVPDTDNEKTTSKETVSEERTLNYVLLVDGKNEPSIMNTYVKPQAKVIEKDGIYYAQMTILKSAWVTGITVDQQGNQVEPKLVSIIDNVKIIEFAVNDFEQPIRIWVKVDIPELSYYHQYFVHLKFDQQQVAKLFSKPFEVKTSEQAKDVKPLVVDKEVKRQSPIVMVEESISKPALSTLPSVQPIMPKEEQLAFDRTLDALTEDDVKEEAEEAEIKEEITTKKPMQDSKADQQLAQLNVVKVILLIGICILSGLLLVRRIKNSKKDVTEQK